MLWCSLKCSQIWHYLWVHLWNISSGLCCPVDTATCGPDSSQYVNMVNTMTHREQDYNYCQSLTWDICYFFQKHINLIWTVPRFIRQDVTFYVMFTFLIKLVLNCGTQIPFSFSSGVQHYKYLYCLEFASIFFPQVTSVFSFSPVP